MTAPASCQNLQQLNVNKYCWLSIASCGNMPSIGQKFAFVL